MLNNHYAIKRDGGKDQEQADLHRSDARVLAKRSRTHFLQRALVQAVPAFVATAVDPLGVRAAIFAFDVKMTFAMRTFPRADAIEMIALGAEDAFRACLAQERRGVRGVAADGRRFFTVLRHL
jgi:hypothetical protein